MQMNLSANTIEEIALEINKRANEYAIGRLQELRTEIRGLARRPGTAIFSSQTISEEWAFHNGGRTELQFNIGLEPKYNELRHGVAFSFETSQTLPSVDILVPKVRRFNEFLRLYPERYEDMRMWWYDERGRSTDYMPCPIDANLVTVGRFLFMGKRQPLDVVDYDLILRDFDRLLPLYKYAEKADVTRPELSVSRSSFEFRAGCSAKKASTVASNVERQLNINLRHNELQAALYQRLIERHGKDNVGAEIPSGVGTFIDLVAREADGLSFYEIKTALSPRACLREAIGQLLEYSFWPGAREPVKLIVVGEGPRDKECEEYLARINPKFPLPIDYEQLIVE